MAQSGTRHPQTRISGQIIIDELLRNMELGRLEMAYSILLPCIFHIYLHPDDYQRLISVQELIREDSKRALNAALQTWNGRGSVFRRGAPRKEHRIAQSDWWIELFADTEGAVPPGDVEIHSELNETGQPGYRGAKTTLLDREPSVAGRATTRRNADKVLAEIRYQDDSGPQTFTMTQSEISVGRGGEDLWVDLPLYSSEQVSREHLRLRRHPGGAFTIEDKSRNGTWVNGKRLDRGVELPLPDRAEIGIAEVLTLRFERR